MADSIIDLSICILTRNQPLLLSQCIVSCLAEVERAQARAEIIVVDNASADRYPETLLALSPFVRVIRNEQNVGFSAGNNQAIRASRGRYVLILNDDAILQEGCLALLLLELESHPDVGAVGPKLLNPDGSVQESYTNRRFPRLRFLVFQFLRLERAVERKKLTRVLFSQNRDLHASGETDYVAGACLLAPRVALDAVNLFDEEFYYWFEDADLCYRLKHAGWRVVYLSEARVTHHGSASLGRLSKLERSDLSFQSLRRFVDKHYNPAKSFMVRMMLALVLLFRLPVAVVAWALALNGSRVVWLDRIKASFRALRWMVTEPVAERHVRTRGNSRSA